MSVEEGAPLLFGPVPSFPGDSEEAPKNVPRPFVKIHRRVGERLGLDLMESKGKFVVSDGQREVLALWALLLTLSVSLVLLLVGQALDSTPVFAVGAGLAALMVGQVAVMVRLTTTLDRRRRRMVQEKTRFLCWSWRSEWDLDDVASFDQEGVGKAGCIWARLSSGEKVAMTYPSVLGNPEDLKRNGPMRLNNFLLRVRGQAKRRPLPTHVMVREDWSAEEDAPGRDGILDLVKNEVVKVVEIPEDGSGWWKGKLSNGKIGYFPVNHTMEMAPSEIAAGLKKLQEQERLEQE